MPVPDVTNLIRRAREGDPTAYDLLVDRYADRLFGYLYRLIGSRTDAEDLLQELFVRVVRMLPHYRHHGAFDGWLFRIATNLARDHVRRVRRTPATLSLSAKHHPGDRGRNGFERWTDLTDPAPESRLERQEDVDALQWALAALPAAEREVVMLRHFSELSFAQIAEAMGTPLGTALARAHRGLGKLRKMMESAHDPQRPRYSR
jgi:RNA polymerase sigma-70 factor (ECF subfamily)